MAGRGAGVGGLGARRSGLELRARGQTQRPQGRGCPRGGSSSTATGRALPHAGPAPHAEAEGQGLPGVLRRASHHPPYPSHAPPICGGSGVWRSPRAFASERYPSLNGRQEMVVSSPLRMLRVFNSKSLLTQYPEQSMAR